MDKQDETTTAKPFSAKTVEKLAAPGYHKDGGAKGLYLQITGKGAKSWLHRFKFKGKKREMGLGAYPLFSLAEARNQANTARQLLAQGIDPIEHKRQKLAESAAAWDKRRTFRQCAAECIDAKREGWQNAKHAEQWTSTLETYAGPVLGDMFVDQITNADVERVLRPIWASKHETATRVRGRIEEVLNWAKVKGYRTGENPAVWRGNLKVLFANVRRVKPKKNHPALPYARLYEFLQNLRAEKGDAARCLEFTILTAARTQESTLARPEEVSGDVWTVPGERMKMKVEHRVPLSPRALEIVRAQPKGEFLFTDKRKGSTSALSNAAMLELIKRMKENGTLPEGVVYFTPHGFRSTFSTWASEETATPNFVTEMALAHKISNDVEAAYRRGDLFTKRAKLMQAWANYCDKPAKRADVLPLRRRALETA